MMADLKDRMEFEDGFIAILITIALRHRRRFEKLLGSPPNPANITEEFWEEVQADNRDEILKWIVIIFGNSAAQHSDGFFVAPDMIKAGAENWAITRMTRVVNILMHHSRNIVRKWILKSVEQGPISDADQQREVDSRLDVLFGDDRMERMGSTETSQAANAGSEFITRQLDTMSAGDLWWTRADERVCPYCGPLHLKQREDWSRIYHEVILPTFPAGAAYGPPDMPPAHVRCRCWVSYASNAGEN